jgi:lipoprotein-releasing system permease protein
MFFFSSFEIDVAKRFAFPNRGNGQKPTFITLVATIGIMLSTAALILTLSIVQGFSQEIESKIIGFGSHLHALSLRDEGIAVKRGASDIAKITAHHNVKHVSAFLEKQVVVKSKLKNGESALEPAMLKGTDITRDSSFIRTKLISGAYFADSTSLAKDVVPLLLGKKLAERLGLQVGDDALVLATSLGMASIQLETDKDLKEAMQRLRISSARVVGIYETGMSQGFDDAMAFTTLPALQTFADDPTITGYEITLNDLSTLGRTAKEISDLLGFPFYTRTIYQIYQSIFVWLRFQENIIPLLLISVSIVAGFNIVSTLLIIVLEKGREVGVMMSFGASAKNVRRIFISQAVLMALVGVLLGNGVALGFSLLEKSLHLISLSEETYFIRNVAIAIDWKNYLGVSLFSLGVAALASLIPASLAARLKPVEAIKF